MNATIGLGFKVASDQFNNWAYGIKADAQTLALYSAVVRTINAIAIPSILALTDMHKPLVDLFEKILEVNQDPSQYKHFVETADSLFPSVLKSAALVVGTFTVVETGSRIAAKYMTDKTSTQPITWNQAIGLCKAEFCNVVIAGCVGGVAGGLVASAR